jgi:hypothetical protein
VPLKQESLTKRHITCGLPNNLQIMDINALLYTPVVLVRPNIGVLNEINESAPVTVDYKPSDARTITYRPKPTPRKRQGKRQIKGQTITTEESFSGKTSDRSSAKRHLMLLGAERAITKKRAPKLTASFKRMMIKD